EEEEPLPPLMTWGLLARLCGGLGLLLTYPALAAKKDTSGGSKVCSHTGFYSKKVVPLCEKHFPDPASKNVWVVQFYHPQVQQVVSQRESFEELASAPEKLGGGAKVGAVDCAQNAEFCQKQGVREAPTTRILLGGQSREFSGSQPTAEELRAFVEESKQRFKDMAEALTCDAKGLFTDQMKDVAMPLCTANFPPSLEPVPWLVSFYEPGDRNKDKTMRSTLNKLAEKYGNVPPKKDAKNSKPLKLRVGAVDCSHSKSDCVKHGVTSFPTVRFYRSGAPPVDFDEKFDKDELKKWTEQRLKEIPKPEQVEVLAADIPESEPKGEL
ncbi:unnamed protein product, partial [Polarella glacialis]